MTQVDIKRQGSRARTSLGPNLKSSQIKPGIIDVTNLDPSTTITMLYHLHHTLPLKVYKAPVRLQDNKDSKIRISPIRVTSADERDSVPSEEYIWVCDYQDTLRSIAKAMFKDFSEEDAKNLQEDTAKSVRRKCLWRFNIPKMYIL